MKLTKSYIKQLIKEELGQLDPLRGCPEACAHVCRMLKDCQTDLGNCRKRHLKEQQADPCGQKPPLPKNWQSIKKGQPGWNERLAFRKWYICKKKGGKGAPAAQQQQQPQQQQPQQQQAQQGQQGPLKLINDGWEGAMNILFNPQEWTKATGLRQDRTRQLIKKVMNPFMTSIRNGLRDLKKQQQTKGQ